MSLEFVNPISLLSLSIYEKQVPVSSRLVNDSIYVCDLLSVYGSLVYYKLPTQWPDSNL